MLNLIKKDLIVSYSNKTSVIMILLYFPIILLLLGDSDVRSIFAFTTFSFVFIMIKIPFSYEMRDRPQIFIQSLPVKKRDIVISKYISIFLNFIFGIVYTFGYMWMSDLIGLINVDKIGISTILSTLGFTILASSISMPMQFRFTFKIANLLNMIFYIIIINFIIIDGDIIFRLLSVDLNNLYNILLIGVGILAVYLISLMISIGFYESRKFY